MQLFDSSSLIFPRMQPLPEILGSPRLKQEILDQLYANPDADILFHSLSQQAQNAFLEFCMGSRGLKVTFDPFFQAIFNPDLHPERLNRLLSCILGQEVTVAQRLSREHSRISEKGSLIIMDILVRLSDGCLVNVEMQRIGYDFPGERGSCYGADLLMRQYDLIHENQGKDFSYRDMKPVYVIVFLEKSTSATGRKPKDIV